jgi:hypothetical protein
VKGKIDNHLGQLVFPASGARLELRTQNFFVIPPVPLFSSASHPEPRTSFLSRPPRIPRFSCPSRLSYPPLTQNSKLITHNWLHFTRPASPGNLSPLTRGAHLRGLAASINERRRSAQIVQLNVCESVIWMGCTSKWPAKQRGVSRRKMEDEDAAKIRKRFLL